MFVINHKKVFVLISAILVTIALGLVAVLGLDLSIEFTGGNIFEVEYDSQQDRPSRAVLGQNLEVVGVENAIIQPVEDNRFAIRSNFLTEANTEAVREVLQSDGGEIVRESSVGPSVGQELRTKSIVAIIVVSLAIIAFIAFAFRRVSQPVKSWKYGAIAIVALLHDIIIPTGFFALLGYLVGYQVDLLFVMGLLVILGYSVNDTIVVFDRVRENLLLEIDKSENGRVEKRFGTVVGEALNQTFARSFNTSLTTLLVLACLYIFGGESTNHFALMLIVGIASGTYSSIFLASPLLVMLAGDKDIEIDEDEHQAATQTREERRASMVDPGLA